MKKSKKTKDKKKADKVVLCVLGCFIVFFTVICILVNTSSYFKRVSFSIDYLTFSVVNYEKSNDSFNVLFNEKLGCYIKYSSNISLENELMNYGNKEKVNDNDWVKQEFENGVTWISYYKNSYYIIQMYANDEDIYNNKCKEDFEEIKSTFSFMKNE